ncbi:MAG: MazG family protein [Actinobacteria bacterium]|nr:MazG family protein [Actinomycetota bacterium]
MPLLVVPLAPGDTGSLTLDEWDSLTSCERVFFERPGHPLRARLDSAGMATGPFDDELSAARDGWALVADPASPRVVELARAGAQVRTGALHSPDGLTAAYGAPVARPAGAGFAGLTALMARLRGPDGCPWDREQTHGSLEVHLQEEAYEVLEAIDEGLLGAELAEELGDLLLQVLFHAQLARDDCRFDIGDVLAALEAKLVARHPHVFDVTEVADAGEVVRNWDAIKAAEKGRVDPFEGIGRDLSALLAAYKTQKRAGAAGWSADSAEAGDRARAALGASIDAASIGEALFWCVAAARAAGVDPESALRARTTSFRKSTSALLTSGQTGKETR